MTQRRQINKFTVITPCFNAEKYIEETIQSIVNQTAVTSRRVELQYIICDGGSSDKTLEIIEKYKNQHKIIVISENDNGMYDALAKGIQISSGDVCSYLNAGDFYFHTAFDVALEIMQHNEVSWLTGINVCCNEKSQIISFTTPFKYRTVFIQSGIYGSILPFIQQESTFWRGELNAMIDLDQLRTFRAAGDYFLWVCFSKRYRLYIVHSYLGSFKVHQHQLSSNMNLYLNEVKKITKSKMYLRILAYLEFVFWKLPQSLKIKLNKDSFFRYDIKIAVWRN